jgi:hypothetical protein
MTFHLKPETQAKLEAHAAALGISVDDYLESLVERQLPADDTTTLASETASAQFQKEHGVWVYRTGDTMPPSLVENTRESIRREREEGLFRNSPR